MTPTGVIEQIRDKRLGMEVCVAGAPCLVVPAFTFPPQRSQM